MSLEAPETTAVTAYMVSDVFDRADYATIDLSQLPQEVVEIPVEWLQPMPPIFIRLPYILMPPINQ